MNPQKAGNVVFRSYSLSVLSSLRIRYGTRPPDVDLLLSALNNRRKLVTAFFIDETGGEGPFGDFILFFGDGGGDDDGVNIWNITMRPAMFGRALSWFTAPLNNGGND